jgi:hypothetical protein
MKKSLYHIEKEYLEIITQVDELQGELTPELEEALKINASQLQGKSIAYLEFIGSREELNTRVDAEIKRLQALKKQNNNLISNLKNRLLEAVKMFGSFEVGLTKFGTRKSTSVQVADVNSLPKEYKVVKLSEQADKKAIKDALKSGEVIEGCEIVESLNLKIN